ncbi:hypothetical protein HU200_019802 [Digitaria exilis]|uniref:Uncharacterized protein n=1 Tax=Digitaria exilis TaxID=1010633 RepID=A0A835F2L6_9POAL|nr:hypothetical protein HU200_019802 [Digitaria exilis]CAB3463262.1 unnamed protein product [Digitaria exilis]
MASDRGEVDTSSAFRSVKEAVAVFGERLVREGHFRPNGGAAHGDRRVDREVNPRANGVAIAASDAKLEQSDGVRVSDHHPREESYSKPSVTFNFNAKQEGSSSSNDSKTASNQLPAAPRSVSEYVPMYLVPTSPPFFASSPSLANDEDDDDEQDLMVMSSIKKLEEEAARTRQEVAQLKRRLADMELSMATLNAKLHRALSKVAHMEADNAAAARASIERGRSSGDMTLAVWAERRRDPSRPQLGHLLSLGDADREAVVAGGGGRAVAAPARRNVQKQKPIVPLVVPLINGVLFCKKRKTKDKESVYMKELYSLLRLS